MVKVYQNKNFHDYRKGTPNAADLSLVAEVNTDNLNTAYRDTNTIDQYWWENQGVTRKFEGEGCRSTSVGDVMEKDGEFFVVAMCGFEKLEDFKL